MPVTAFPEPQTWQMVVESVDDLTPRMRRIRLSAPGLERLIELPGQDIALAFRAEDGSKVRRRYSIRAFDRERGLIEIVVVMHGDGPGMRWASSARKGMDIEGIAPRGKITIEPDADWHLFAGDATAVPGSFAMMERLPSGKQAFGFFLVDSPQERLPFGATGSVQWRYGEPSIGAGSLLNAFQEIESRSGAGHAYLAGEVGLVTSLKAELLNQGWSPEQISGKAYWNQGRANAGHGEPEQKVS